MEHQLAFTHFLNQHFGALVLRLLTGLHVQPENPVAPINNAFAMELIAFAALIVIFLAVRARLSVEDPGAVQHLAESYYEMTDDQGRQVIGDGHERFMPFVGALFLFILVGNLLGLLPGLEAPTSYLVVPLGCAIATFVYYNYHGIRVQGLWGYIKHFFGPVWWLAPLLFPIEIISHCARMLSLTVRLYANMMAGDLLTLVFFSLFPIGLPILFLGLHLGVSVIQAYLFAVLAMIYLSQAVAHSESH